MRILAADSACSYLDESLMPKCIMNSAAVVLDHPYREPSLVRIVTADYQITDPNVLVYELRLCRDILASEQVDCVHLDLSLGGINILTITEEMLWRMPLSTYGREVLKLILPELQRIALDIGEKYKVPVYAMGSKSMAVRVAELHAAAAAVSRAAQHASAAETPLVVGLPRRASALFEGGRLRIVSREPMEYDYWVEAPLPHGVAVDTFVNPVARDFHALRLASA
jgi:hypothetical protein